MTTRAPRPPSTRDSLQAWQHYYLDKAEYSFSVAAILVQSACADMLAVEHRSPESPANGDDDDAKSLLTRWDSKGGSLADDASKEVAYQEQTEPPVFTDQQRFYLQRRTDVEGGRQEKITDVQPVRWTDTQRARLKETEEKVEMAMHYLAAAKERYYQDEKDNPGGAHNFSQLQYVIDNCVDVLAKGIDYSERRAKNCAKRAHLPGYKLTIDEAKADLETAGLMLDMSKNIKDTRSLMPVRDSEWAKAKDACQLLPDLLDEVKGVAVGPLKLYDQHLPGSLTPIGGDAPCAQTLVHALITMERAVNNSLIAADAFRKRPANRAELDYVNGQMRESTSQARLAMRSVLGSLQDIGDRVQTLEADDFTIMENSKVALLGLGQLVKEVEQLLPLVKAAGLGGR